ncbi:MAG: Gfo/Idh/MocA family oxidoreductase [Flavobacteriales bacterium]
MNKTLLVGAGNMAKHYAPILDALHVDYEVVCQSTSTAETFFEKTGHSCQAGGLENLLQNTAKPYSKAIVAVGVEYLFGACVALMEHGTQIILVEKPGGLTVPEIVALGEKAKKYSANLYIAYNRRFYASVLKAKQMIEEDGGALSGNFEFTEWSHVIAPLEKAPGVKENWFLANSTHVVDLAFYLLGKPISMSTYAGDAVEWHTPAIFAGAGLTDQGAFFTYRANWKSPGRWGVEVLTAKRKLVLQPMEKLQEQLHGTVAIVDVTIEDSLDLQYKHGLFLQTSAFIHGDFEILKSLDEQLKDVLIFDKMLKTSA